MGLSKLASLHRLVPLTSSKLSLIFNYLIIIFHSGTIPVQPAFLDKLSATIQQQRRQLETTRAKSVREMINQHAQVRKNTL